MATHSSILTWRILWTEELGRLQSMELQRVRHNSVTNTLSGKNEMMNTYISIHVRIPDAKPNKCYFIFSNSSQCLLSQVPSSQMDRALVVAKNHLSHAWNWFIPFRNSKCKISSVAQSCPTLCDPNICSLPGSSVHRILQVRILEWVVIPFSRGIFLPRDQIQVSCIAGGFFTV